MSYRRLRRPRSTRGPALFLLTALAVLAGLALAAVLARPRVTELRPSPGAMNLSPRARLHITFNQPMDLASVEAALHVEPALPGAFAWDAEGKTLTFTPKRSWPLLGEVRASLTGGQSRLGLPLFERTEWTFTIGRERIAYLSGAPPNLAAISIGEGATAEPLTAEPYGVHDFAVHPEGGWMAYSAVRADGGADLKRVDVDGANAALLLACPDAVCRAPAFSPDGRRLAYERQTPTLDAAGNRAFGEPRIYVLTLASGQTVQIGDLANPAHTPRWSPDGRLSFYDTVRRAIVVQDVATGAVTFVPNDSGEMGTWSPAGRFLVFPEIVLQANAITLPESPVATETVTVQVTGFYSYLRRVEVSTNTAVNLTGAGVVEDASPVYSFNGDWLAFARRGLTPETWTPGRQLWVMRADGSEARQLTDEPEFAHSAFAWSFDEQRIAYMRLNATDLSQPPEIWIITPTDGSTRRLVSGGYSPQWLP
ncbi:MAG: Ig-like domain-containing protein [Anaerolineales bacterium]|nr:Ig-like domain-containing protein [Anaerolineales bacterium]